MATSNKLTDLHPDLARVYAEAKADYLAQHPGGLRPQLGETYRSAAVQTAYYAQGRQPLASINELRKSAGLSPIDSGEAGRKITHAQAGQSPHGFYPARAFDVQMVKLNGTIDWSDSPYQDFATCVKKAAAKLGVAVSIGAFWPKFVDAPHTELAGWAEM